MKSPTDAGPRGLTPPLSWALIHRTPPWIQAVGQPFVMWFHAVLTRQFRRVNTLTAPPPSQSVRRALGPMPATVQHARAVEEDIPPFSVLHFSAGLRPQPNCQSAFRHARNPSAGIHPSNPSCPQSSSGHPGGVGNGFPPEDCGNDELIFSHRILAPLGDSQT